MTQRAGFDEAVLSYTRESILNVKQVAAALQVSVRTVERLDIPCFYLGTRTRRYIWGKVLDFCEKRLESW